MERKNSTLIVVILLLIVIFVLYFVIYFNFKIGDVGDSNKQYIGKNKNECSRVQFLCVPGFERFDDKKGCGCEKSEAEIENYCNEESRKGDVCITLYKPVCGWFDSEKIQCIKFPCAETYSNSCFACLDEKVLYWTESECPSDA